MCTRVIYREKGRDISDELAVEFSQRFLTVEISFLCLKGFKLRNGNICCDVLRSL
jgi:hypothetical protein